MVCAEYDATMTHGSMREREYEGLRIFEIFNNWSFESFATSYRDPAMDRALADVLDSFQPEILHLQSLLNLSFRLPAIARERGIPSLATLHDFSLVCASGGQRVHLADQHVCHAIDTDRCARCFPATHFHSQMVAAANPPVERPTKRPQRIAWKLSRKLGLQSDPPRNEMPVTTGDIDARLEYLRDEVFPAVDVFVAPSQALGEDMKRFGMPADRVVVSDYGFLPLRGTVDRTAADELRIGFVGSLVWHKGVHVLLEAFSKLPHDRTRLLVYGATDTVPEYTDRIREMAKGLPVTFEGRFDANDVARVYSSFDVAVVCSLWPENSPLVIHEAFQAGVPIVGADQGGIPGLVTHDVDGLIYEAYDPDDLAAKLRRFLDEPELLPRFAAAIPGVKSMEQDADEWVERYRTSLARTRSGG